MDYIGMEFSGEYDFVQTEMYWPLNHQVSPKEQSLSCIDCHTRDNSRLAQLTDFYLPGRDYYYLVEYAGIGLIVLALSGSFVHGISRFILRKL